MKKLSLRFGLRAKLLLLSSFLFVIPWFGYQYVWEMEKYLRYGQEQTLVGTARALATALHERANLFNNQASFLPSVEKGKDLYGYQLNKPIRLDGLNKDWPYYQQRAHYYNNEHHISSIGLNPKNQKTSLSFSASVGKYDKYLYLFFTVLDDRLVFRDDNARSIVNNDHLELAFNDSNNHFKRFIISNKKPGWLSAFHVQQVEETIPNAKNPIMLRDKIVPAPKIQGQWLKTAQGYNLELRIPLSDIGDNIAFAFHDIDQKNGEKLSSIGSADPRMPDTLGTMLVPSPEIERIVKGMSYTNSSIWVVDQHHRVLASAGSLKTAGGVWQKSKFNQQREQVNLWQQFKENWLLPLYYQVLTKPPTDFIDKLYDAQHLTGRHIVSALDGQAKSQWRLTTDQKALVLSAAYPIFINEKVKGAVIVEETTNGIRTVRNHALERLFTAILAILFLGALAFILFATRISSRIRELSNQAELAIDEHGRITGEMVASTVNDEIGDLSRSFALAVNRLGQYNYYLENMSGRLSHELRTPIAVVKTSLEVLSLQSANTELEKNGAYIERAQTGINTLNLILTNMTEATRLEEMLANTEKSSFDVKTLLQGCITGYQHVYPDMGFSLRLDDKIKASTKLLMNGSPEHIVQLLDKVINNAVEFSDDYQVAVIVSQLQDDLVINISNNGVHLPKAMENSLFDSMVSIRSKSRQLQPHLGLGLYIARLICHFHQGKVSAKNHYNKDGVTLIIILPLNGKNDI